MSESVLHRKMKAVVAAELTKEGYDVIEEPLWPPNRFVSWQAYRPDLLGLVCTDGKEEYALVECETQPRTQRLLSKNIWKVELQSKMDRQAR